MDLCLGSYSLLALTSWACETPDVCSLTRGWLCHSREQGIATKISTLSTGLYKIVPFLQVLELLLSRTSGIYLRGALQGSTKRV